MTKNCRRCSIEKTRLTVTEDEIGRIARQMSRAKTPAKLSALRESLEIHKAVRADERQRIERGHECDTRLSDEHWTKVQA